MTGNYLLLLIGAVCGVLAAFFVFAAGQLWLLIVPPLFRRWRYRGVNISGEWKGLGASPAPASGEWSEVALSLKQDTHDLRGLMTLRHRSAGQSFDLNLRVAGRISQRHVILNLSPVGKGNTSVATALLKAEDGMALTGQLLFNNPFAGNIDAINVSVHHADSIATPRLNAASRAPSGMPALQPGTALAAAAAE